LTDTTTHPYARLTPDVVLNALEGLGLRCDGRLLALASYENRVYQVGLEETERMRFVVAKFYRPNRWSDEAIAEEHAFAAMLAAKEIPVVAPLGFAGATLHRFEGFRFAVYPRAGGRAPELEDPKTLEWLGRFIARIHMVGSTRRFEHRPRLDIERFGVEPRAFLAASGFIPADLVAPWTQVADLALEGVRHAYARAGDVREIRVHGDCHVGNVLWVDDSSAARPSTTGPHFVDLDDTCMAPAIQDLWMLVSGDRHSMSLQLGHILDGYADFMEFDTRELQLMEALRTLRLLHYSAWLARRWDDPAFPIVFPWFNTPRYWQDRILELREQVAAMQEPAIEPG